VTDIDPAFIQVKENAARDAARDMAVQLGQGVIISNYAELVDVSKYMSKSGWAVRKELRDNIGACMMIAELAQQWGFNRWQLAKACFVINDILCFESVVLHGVVEKFAPLKQRLRVRYEGEGAKRKAIISGHIKGEVDPLEYESPEIGIIHPKNSPLWKTDPDQQLFYLASQRWCRRYCPDVLLGIHDVEQVQDAPSIAPDRPAIGFANAKDVTPKLADRLPAAAPPGEGFAEDNVAVIEAEINAARGETE
jgi:hypothetical protein